MKNPAFIINPLSHSVAKSGSVLQKTGRTNRENCTVLQSFETLNSAVANILKTGNDHVFIEGGDGTIHGVLSAFMNHQPHIDKLPEFTLLPGGMTNLVAAHVGLKRPSVKKLTGLMDGVRTPNRVDLSMLAVKAAGADKTHYGFLLSTGALPAATRYCLDHVHTKGIGGSAAVRSTLLKVMLGRKREREAILTPTPLYLDLGEKQLDGDHIVTITTPLPRLMIGLKPFWGKGDGPLMITHVRKNAKHLKRNIARMLLPGQSSRAHRALKRDGFQSWNIEHAKVRLDGEMVLDGEFLPRTNAPISLYATKPLRFIK